MNSVRVFRHGLRVGVQDFRVNWHSWYMWVLTWLLRVSTTAIMWVLLGRMVGSEEQVRFLLVGQAVMVGPQAAGWVAAASTWDRFAGTYPLLVVAPSGLVPAMIGRTAIWLLNGIGTSLATFAVLIVGFGFRPSLAAAPMVMALIVIVCASFYGLALVLGALVIRTPGLRNVVHNIASIVTTAVCGVVVPVSFWPEWVEVVAHALPVTHGLAAIRGVLAQRPPLEILSGAFLELVVGLAWFALGIFSIGRMADTGRRDGSIELAS